MNSVCLVGNLTRKPEIRYTPDGTPVAKFSIAVNEGYGDKQKAHFFDIDVWDKRAENCEKYLDKGSKVAVQGRLRQERWEASDGGKRSRVVVNARDVMFLSPKTDKADDMQSGDVI